MTGAALKRHFRQHRPAFFFNACEIGRLGWALTRLGGWANKLISLGAGLFIGPLWEVTDSSALTFASSFYQSLLEGDTVSVAAQQARAAARQIGDSTWLAYSVYAHPNARLMQD
jgi:CHAT domain-containing protein